MEEKETKRTSEDERKNFVSVSLLVFYVLSFVSVAVTSIFRCKSKVSTVCASFLSPKTRPGSLVFLFFSSILSLSCPQLFSFCSAVSFTLLSPPPLLFLVSHSSRLPFAASDPKTVRYESAFISSFTSLSASSFSSKFSSSLYFHSKLYEEKERTFILSFTVCLQHSFSFVSVLFWGSIQQRNTTEEESNRCCMSSSSSVSFFICLLFNCSWSCHCNQ